jgi:hypothetical protein
MVDRPSPGHGDQESQSAMARRGQWLLRKARGVLATNRYAGRIPAGRMLHARFTWFSSWTPGVIMRVSGHNPGERSRLGVLAMLVACALCASAAAPALAATPESMLVNPGFDSGDFTGWSTFYSAGEGGLGQHGIGTGGTGSLTGYFAYAEAGDGDVAYFEQTVYLYPGQTYNLQAGVASLWGGGANADGGNVEVTVNGIPVGTWMCGGINFPQVNAVIAASFTASQVANDIRLSITRSYGEESEETPYTCVDNISVTPADAAVLASVVHVDPAPGSGVSHAQTTIRIDFSQALDPASLTPSAITLVRSGGDGTFNDGNEVVVTPTSVTMLSPFSILMGIDASSAPDDLYQLTVSGSGASALTDVHGQAIDGEYAGTLPTGDGIAGGDFVCQFGISTAPTVTAVAPADGAVGVQAASAIQLTFSKAMNQAAVESAFTISPTLSGTFSWLGTTLTFQPSSPLLANTAYAITLAAGATDTFDAPLAAPFGFGFTTASAWSGTPLAPGPIANLLHLGTTGGDAIIGYPTSGLWIGWDNFIYAGAGYEYQQQPGAGQAVDMAVAQTETPLVWTALSAPGGVWIENAPQAYTMYYAIYVTAPSTRQVCLAYSSPDNVRGWMDGGFAPVVSDDTGSPSAPFLLTAGTHVFLFKTTNLGGGGGSFQIQFTDPAGATMGDLLAQLDDPIAPSMAGLISPSVTAAVPLWSDVLIAFSEPMDTTIAASTVGALVPAVAGTWSWSDPTHLCFTPNGIAPGGFLAPGTTYTVALAGAQALDRSGNQLSGPNSVSFTTTATLSAPGLASVSPAHPPSGSPLLLQVNGTGFIAGGIIHPPGALPFGGHLYTFYNVPQTWVAGQASCAALGGHLVTISSQAEDAFAWQLEGRLNGFIGFQDLVEPQEVFSWVDNEPVTYTNWAQGEPNNFNDAIEDKTIYWWGFQWNSVEDGARPYTGEYDRPQPPAILLVKAGAPAIAATQVQLVDAGTLTAQFAIVGAAPGAYDVVVTNPDGGQAVLSGAVTLAATPPAALPGTLQVAADGTGQGTLTAVPANGDAVTFAIATLPVHGTVTMIDALAGTFSYTVDAGYIGSDSFTFTAGDGVAVSAPATISITVVGTPPQLAVPTTTTDGWIRAGPAGPFQLSGTASDVLGITQVSYTMSGATVGSGLASGTTAWSISTTVNTGTTIMVVTATNVLGLSVSQQRYLAADATDALVSIDFQDALSAVASGCVADRGDPFGDRGNGWSYGWSAENPNGRNRADPAALEPRYNTFIHMQQYGTYSWSLAVPNGAYLARIVCGDEQVNSVSVNNLLVNGIPIMDGGVTPRFDDYLVPLVVTGNLITIAPGPSAINVKLCYLDLLPLGRADGALVISPDGAVFAAGPVAVTFSFGAPVAGFGLGMITVQNGSASAFTAIDDSTYTVSVTPTAPGPVTVAVAAGAVATIASGVPNDAATATFGFDPLVPTAVITPNGITTNASPIIFQVAFSEPVSGFGVQNIAFSGNAAQGIFVTNGYLAGPVSAIDAAHYLVPVNPASISVGPVGISLAAGAAFDAAGTPSLPASALVEIDLVAPTATITPNAASVASGPITFTLTFSEAVVGLTAAGVSAAGGSVQSFTAVDSAHYQAVVQPAAPGNVTLTLAAAAATDLAGNPCPMALATVTYDPLDPVLTITPDQTATNAQPITFTFAFSAAVSGFDLASITVENGTAGTFSAIDGADYTLTVAPSAPGAVTVSVPAGAAVDAHGAANPAATATVDYLTAGPSPSFSGPSSSSAAPLAVEIQFDEPVIGFAGGGLVIANGTLASFLALDPSTFVVEVAPQAPGTVTLTIPVGAAFDLAGNANVAASTTIDYLPSPPTVSISPNGILVNAAPIVFTLTYSEITQSPGSLVATNGTVTSYGGGSSSTQTVVYVNPTAPGPVSLSVGSGTFFNDANVANVFGASAIVTYVPGAVPLAITPNGSTSNADPILFQFAFATGVTGFSAASVTIANGTAGTWTAVDAAHYQLAVTPVADGPVQVAVAAGVCADSLNDANLAATAVVTSDFLPPTVAMTPDGTSTDLAPIVFTLVFSEALADFDPSLLSIGNGALGTVTAIDATHVTVAVAPAGQGAVTLSCPAGAYHDAAGNPISAASASVTYLPLDPSVLITPNGTATNSDPIVFTLTLSDPLADFIPAALIIGNGSLGVVSTVDALHVTVAVVPSGQGAVTLTCPAGTYYDGAGNPNIAATSSVTYDTIDPTVAITPSGTATNGAPIIFTLAFSEPLADFTPAALLIGNGALGAVTTVDALHVTVAVAPAGQGAVTLACPAGTCHDAAGNPNSAASASVTYDTIDPTVAITPSGTVTDSAPIVFTLAFSETLPDFTAASLILGNGTLGAVTTVDALHVTVAVAPTVQGAVTLTCPAGAYHDAAGNPIIAATSSVTYDTIDPTVAITPSGTVTSSTPIVFTLAFSETLPDFTAASLILGNGTLGAVTTVDALHVTVAVAPTAQGAVTLTCPAGSCHDAAGNPNIAAAASVIYDTSDLTVAITPSGTATNSTPIVFTLSFSEAVSGFDPSLLTITNGTVGQITTVDASHVTVAVAPLAQGAVVLACATGVAKDATGNPSTSASASVQFVTTPPAVTITPNGTVATSSPIVFTLSFSEAVSGFNPAPLTITNGTVGQITTVDASHVTIAVTPTYQGMVTVSCPSGIAHDAAGNASAAATAGVTYDPIIPTWMPATGQLMTARAYQTATLLPSGEVLVAGGLNGNALTSSERYDPRRGTCTVTAGSLAYARYQHTATLLPSGLVLVAGGWSSNGGANQATCELFDPDTGTWSATGSMTAARAEHTATLLPSGLVLVAGGIGAGGSSVLAGSELYDPATGTWTATTGPMTAPRSEHIAVLLPAGHVLVAGGVSTDGPVASSEIFDPASGTWSATSGAMAAARYQHTGTLLATGDVLIAGGGGSTGPPLTSSELYHPGTGTWSPTAGALTGGRFMDPATLLPSGLVLVEGGLDPQDGASLASSELYDPATGSWSPTAGPLADARHGHTATVLPSGQVLTVGGFGNGGAALASVECYDPTHGAGSWTSTAAPAAQPRASHTATLLPSGQVLVAAGFDNGLILGSAELYNPATDLWSTTGALANVRVGHTATLLPTGKVLVTGGLGTLAFLTSCELYDPASGTWSATGSMAQARRDHTATLLPTGQVLVAGGVDDLTWLSSCELYDPASGTWTATGPMAQVRSSHTATLLPSGLVLVAGGSDTYSSNAGLASCELYDPATGQWNPTGSLTQARTSYTATLLPSGQVLAVGGLDSAILAACERYDPGSGSWTATAALGYARYNHTATLLPSGQVVAVSGEGYDYTAGITEVYDPAPGVWTTATQTMVWTRQNHTATLLPSGQILAAGGYLANDITVLYLSASERFDRGLGAPPASQPTITALPPALPVSATLNLSGTLFTGLGEGASGGTASSPTDYPLIQIQSGVNEMVQWLPFAAASAISATTVTTQAVLHVPLGPAWVRVFCNGIASPAQALTVIKTQPTISWPSPHALVLGTPLTATQLDATVTPAIPGTFAYAPAAGTVLGAGAQVLTVTFTPADAADYPPAMATTTLTVMAATPVISWPAPASIVYGTALSATQLDATISPAIAGTFTYVPAAGAVLGSGVQNLSVTFIPTDTTDYAPVMASTTLTVAKASTSIVWPAPAAMTYGTALGAAQLDASVSPAIPGAFTYAPAAGTVPGAGVQSLTVTFTPTDTIDYAPLTASTTLTVAKASASIAWPAPAAITYGTALGTTQLDASVSPAIPGTFTYVPAAGTVLDAGVQSLSVTFTPTDATDYAMQTASTTLTVAKASASIVWPAPTAIMYGTALSTTQLDATVDPAIAGTFTYLPAAGTVLSAGAQVLTVTFTPANAANYTTQTASTPLTVTDATETIVWPAPAAISYGTALSTAQLDATVNPAIAGTFTYLPAAGTVLSAGVQVLTVTFTPTDTADFATQTASTTVLVDRTMPTIAWPAPAAITYGSALSATQLDAITDSVIAGSFTYSPALGTRLPAGANQVLSVTFTPSDTLDYRTQTATVALTVLPAPLTISAADGAMPLGGPLPPLEASYSGFVAGDDPSNLTTPAVLATTATASSPAGAYPITVSGASDPDYVITFQSGVLTVTNPSAAAVAPPSDGANFFKCGPGSGLGVLAGMVLLLLRTRLQAQRRGTTTRVGGDRRLP